MHLLKEYALQLVGLPYIWGGDDTIEGFDCSGLVQEILASAGADPPGDQTAQMLYDHFVDIRHGIANRRRLGALAFFGKSYNKITHVGFCIDEYRMITASGGSKATKTRKDAAQHNAYVKMRLIESRKDLIVTIMPRYDKIGVII